MKNQTGDGLDSQPVIERILALSESVVCFRPCNNWVRERSRVRISP